MNHPQHQLFSNYRESDLADQGGNENNKRRSVWLDLGIQTHLDPNGKRSCGRPPKERGTIIYLEGRPIDFDTEHRYDNVSSRHLHCIIISNSYVSHKARHDNMTVPFPAFSMERKRCTDAPVESQRRGVGGKLYALMGVGRRI